MVIRRSSNGLTVMIVSLTVLSSGALWGSTRTATAVGPDDIDGSAGGRTVTSITSREPPKSVTLGRVTVVQAAENPAGVIVYVSVRSPTFSTTTDSEAEVPGRTVVSSCTNHAWTAIEPRRYRRGPVAGRYPSMPG